jgi:hypothetical protein
VFVRNSKTCYVRRSGVARALVSAVDCCDLGSPRFVTSRVFVVRYPNVLFWRPGTPTKNTSSFTWLIVAIWSFAVSSNHAHLLFRDPQRVVLAPRNSKTWYVLRSSVARSSFTSLIVAFCSFVVLSHRAHLLFCDPQRVVLAPRHTHEEHPQHHTVNKRNGNAVVRVLSS